MWKYNSDRGVQIGKESLLDKRLKGGERDVGGYRI